MNKHIGNQLWANDWLGNGALTDLTINFIQPADPENTPFIVTGPTDQERIVIAAAGAVRTIKLVGYLTDTSKPRPILRLKKLNTHPGAGWLGTSPKEHPLITTANFRSTDPQYPQHYLERVEIENLVLDGDFEAQGGFSSAANLAGYKNYAIRIASRTGRIKNVAVRRFGVVGEAPVSYFPNEAQGTETFPVTV